ncbi:ribosome biogenesis GTPase YlqF [Christensenellaceae bacterium OttesenSCG-928-K19]|nr:ribosome biogenesis GTPase YlqF [Christensenellaceae bacterium OttesenSCG-928-K19]
MDIQWYPGHMTKARRQLAKKLKMIDIVIEVLDARAPRSSVNPDFDDLFATKSRFYVLNKADLADEKVTKQWIKYYNSKGIPAVSFSAAAGNTEQLKKSIMDNAKAILQKYEKKGVKKTLRALVVGIPNVGKSAILNRLAGSRKMKEGNKPGVTKALQWAKISDNLEIMDSPGLLWPKFKDEKTGAVVALVGSIKLDILDEEALAFYLIGLLKDSSPQLLIQRYKLKGLKEDDYDILLDIGRRRGFLVKGGEVDVERAAKTVLDEFKNGKMGRISLEAPPGVV